MEDYHSNLRKDLEFFLQWCESDACNIKQDYV